MNLTDNPFTKINTKEVYDNPWISVREDQILKPNGSEGIYGVVHFKNLAIGIIPIDQDGFTYLVGQYRYTLNEYFWEIVEGGGPIGIDPIESAKRELKEETGFSAAKWTKISTLHTSNSVTDEVSYIYMAEDLTEGDTEFEDTEVLQIRKVHISEAVKMVMNDEITDAISIAGILKVAKILNI